MQIFYIYMGSLYFFCHVICALSPCRSRGRQLKMRVHPPDLIGDELIQLGRKKSYTVLSMPPEGVHLQAFGYDSVAQ